MAYFMLRFDPSLKQSDKYWNQKTAILGRDNTKTSDLHKNFCGVGTQKSTSREHASISWNPSRNCWDMKVLGKKGIWSHNRHYKKDYIISLSIDRPTPIKMGNTRFYFCPARPPHH